MDIQKLLTLSTAHITQQEMQRISDDEAQSFVVYPNDYGAFILVEDTGLSCPSEPDMPRLSALAAYARAKGCAWIKLDCDADTIEALPTYDW